MQRAAAHKGVIEMTSFEVTIGSEKQIAWAKELIAKRAAPSMGGHLYVVADGMKWIADYRANIESASAPQEIKDKAFALLDKLPTCAAFWIGGAGNDTRLVIEAILTGTTKHIIGQNAVNLYKALAA